MNSGRLMKRMGEWGGRGPEGVRRGGGGMLRLVLRTQPRSDAVLRNGWSATVGEAPVAAGVAGECTS
jgi:hypothetical protein